VVPWTHISRPPPNGISIGSAVFAQLTRMPNNNTDRHTDHATCVTVGRVYTRRTGDVA